ncbi:hypothetical protein BASA81_004832 [Batrachochytrium salamandrivorans]|nr:hypothetical protein BASA81_004832 [Batrachochytrium salamandrivorans]
MIRVVGTVVMDLLTRVERIPVVGETVIGKGGLRLRLGGKGFNQAIFASQALSSSSSLSPSPPRVLFDASVGRDQFGDMAQAKLMANNVQARLQLSPTKSTGTGSICLEEGSGENCIVVSLGANEDLDANQMHLEPGIKVVLGQLELSLAATLHVFKQESGIRMLNAAPVPLHRTPLLDELLRETDVLVVNQVEAEMLSEPDKEEGKSLLGMAKRLLSTKLHPNALAVVVTLGKQGAFYLTSNGVAGMVPVTKDVAVDTVGAGDCFVGTLAAELMLSDNADFAACVLAANHAAGQYVAVVKPDYALGELLLKQ